MSTELFQAIMLSVSTVVAALLGIPRFFKDDRSDVLVDLQIYEGLPSGSVAKAQLLKRIEEQLAGLDQRRDARRSPSGIVLGLVFIGLAVWMGVLVTQGGGAWLFLLPLVAFILIIGCVGLVQDASRHVRDAKGRPIK